MGKVIRNLARALCACVLALAFHAVAATAQGTGGVTIIEAETPAASTAANTKWNATLAQWEANMLAFGKTHCQTLVNKVDQYGNVQTDNLLVWMTYYDAIEVYLQIYQYTKDGSWLNCAKAAKYAYRDLQVMAQQIPGRVAGYWNFTNGLVLDYKINGDVVSKNAAILLSQNAAFAQDTTPLEWTADPSLSREVAYTIRSYVNAEKLGAPRRPRLADLVTQSISFIDQWFTTKSFRSPEGYATLGLPVGVYYIQPFMVGLTMEGLIAYYEASPDARVLPAIKICLDWLWSNAWVPADGAFWYDNYVANPASQFPARAGAPDLNLLIAPSYAWYYKMTGDTIYRDRGDQVFAGGVKGAYLYGAKQFNQNYSYGFDYVARRNAGLTRTSQPTASASPSGSTITSADPATSDGAPVVGNVAVSPAPSTPSASAPPSVSVPAPSTPAVSAPPSVSVPAPSTPAVSAPPSVSAPAPSTPAVSAPPSVSAPAPSASSAPSSVVVPGASAPSANTVSPSITEPSRALSARERWRDRGRGCKYAMGAPC